ncbi:MAG: hypothetical protein IIB17_08775 [Chloroflexi bacterium]|nr:hypothetical protein [Chloroflexota bacterium]
MQALGLLKSTAYFNCYKTTFERVESFYHASIYFHRSRTVFKPDGVRPGRIRQIVTDACDAADPILNACCDFHARDHADAAPDSDIYGLPHADTNSYAFANLNPGSDTEDRRVARTCDIANAIDALRFFVPRLLHSAAAA